MPSRKTSTLLILLSLFVSLGVSREQSSQPDSSQRTITGIDPSRHLGLWEGWGSSLAWWARAIGGTGNAEYYADLIYSTNSDHGYPGLGLNIVRYNVGGGGIDQRAENKGPKLQWQMNVHGYWTNPDSTDPNSTSWNWSADSNQRTMMLMAHERGAAVFEMFSDSPMWWMNSNHSTAGSASGGNCLSQENYDRFARYLATVARYSADHWGIKFGSVEPFNEPSARWWKYPGRQEGCHFDRDTQQVIVGLLRKALDEKHLNDVAIAASDENDMDVALSTWQSFDSASRQSVGKVNVHGYYQGTKSYRGPNRSALRTAVGGKRLWQSEYGDGDASGYTMASAIIQDIRGLRPNAWVYWQPVEPDVQAYGWGLINVNYIDTLDRSKPEVTTPRVRVNRKFFVYGQFTRYLRPGAELIGIGDENSIAAYDPASKKLILITVTGDKQQTLSYDLRKFTNMGSTVQQTVTTTAPGNGVPDWEQHVETIALMPGNRRTFSTTLYPKSV
ncbi:MAG TPA: glycoside hydrolase, partial [Candidatus Sulfotelmatobacter sp.]|nr:glycoside hydrolase [Candidatus Sulfotelmatobacter sp.]